MAPKGELFARLSEEGPYKECQAKGIFAQIASAVEYMVSRQQGQTDRKTEKQKDRKTERQKDRQIDVLTDKQTNRQKDRVTDRQINRKTERQKDRE